MDTLAVIQSGGKQYVVKENDVIDVEIVKNLKKDDKFSFNEVLLKKDNKGIKIGKPYLKNTKVEAVVIDTVKGDKVNILKFKAKSRYRKRIGHRQNYLRVKIEKI